MINQQSGICDLNTSPASVYGRTTYTDWLGDFRIRVGDAINALHTDAGTLTITIVIGGQTVGCGPVVVTKAAAVLRGEIYTRHLFGLLYIPSGETIAITALSSNASDTSVRVIVDPMDPYELLTDQVAKDVMDMTTAEGKGLSLRDFLQAQTKLIEDEVTII
jgi:hypothetical protein